MFIYYFSSYPSLLILITILFQQPITLTNGKALPKVFEDSDLKEINSDESTINNAVINEKQPEDTDVDNAALDSPLDSNPELKIHQSELQHDSNNLESDFDLHYDIEKNMAVFDVGKDAEKLHYYGDDTDDDLLPDHLDAVRLDREGKLNPRFHEEVFLGEDVEKFEDGHMKEKEKVTELEKIFHLIDTNFDLQIGEGELTEWVLVKIEEHFKEATEQNSDTFTSLDIDKNELISWQEYILEYLSKKGFDREDVDAKLKDNEKISIGPELRDEIEDVKDKWIQASKDGAMDPLNIQEFLDFQHPETSRGMLNFLVEDFIHDMDMDGDGNLTKSEFVSLGAEVDLTNLHDIWMKERLEEFENVIDTDKDNVACKEELERYLDPRSRSSAQQEARQLIGFGDDNYDGKLSLQELLENAEFFIGSKLYNYARSVHYEL